MAPKKLTEADKTSILSLYRQPQETTSTLAERYGVSNSTISRLLKASLPEDEYSILIQQKRGTDKTVVVDTAVAAAEPALPAVVEAEPAISAVVEAEPAVVEAEPAAVDAKPSPKPKTKPRSKRATEVLPEAAPTEPAPLPIAEPIAEEVTASEAKPLRKRRSRAAAEHVPEVVDAPAETMAALPTVDPEPAQLSLPEPAPEKPARPVLKSAQTALAEAQAAAPEIEPAEVLDVAEALDDDWDDDTVGLDDDYDDDDDSDDDDNVYPWDSGNGAAANLETLEIFPLTAAALPPLCYVVVERTSSELVVLPLRTFAELGQIPEEEGDSRTLPVFENHNVARRFSRRNQRVVKVPDGSLLQTTSSYLQAKGITRLFIDGQVFSLGQDSVEPVLPVGDD
ncbi:transposase [Nodosilinea sp. FACHB-131]|uniref:transposase n=1 Tax=Cyanophyceae TaxID=3028117 RepID=UPI001685E52A|nr:transposase [Nodosilinea sp. FACHB-131]MBD1875193.1 transposase [Nodosilinea sp. FACHB-131]